jgi:hypothetical protein
MESPMCPLCQREPLTAPEHHAQQACASCAAQIGIIPMPPRRRPRRPCVACNGSVFVRVLPREHTARGYGTLSVPISAPMYLTHEPQTSPRYSGGNTVESLETRVGHGLVEAYVCRSCGRIEWYCPDAERIPIHPHLMTELVDDVGGDAGPFR